jgi:hypothetical protein
MSVRRVCEYEVSLSGEGSNRFILPQLFFDNTIMTDVATTTDKPLFTAVEIEQFEADDVVAGSAIGKMLSILFLYTVAAMTLVGWWTIDSQRPAEVAPATDSEPANH